MYVFLTLITFWDRLTAFIFEVGVLCMFDKMNRAAILQSWLFRPHILLTVKDTCMWHTHSFNAVAVWAQKEATKGLGFSTPVRSKCAADHDVMEKLRSQTICALESSEVYCFFISEPSSETCVHFIKFLQTQEYYQRASGHSSFCDLVPGTQPQAFDRTIH